MKRILTSIAVLTTLLLINLPPGTTQTGLAAGKFSLAELAQPAPLKGAPNSLLKTYYVDDNAHSLTFNRSISQNGLPKTYYIDDSAPLTVGGGGGEPFSDPEAVAGKGLITKIEIRCGSEIDAIRLYYGNGTIANVGTGIGDWHGGNGGELKVWEVPEGHRIIRIEGRAGDKIDRLQFFTDKQATSPIFGGDGGRPFAATTKEGAGLRTVSGRAGSRIDSLTFRFGLPNYVEKIEYDADALRKAALNFTPVQVATQTLPNYTDLEQTVRYTASSSAENEGTFNWEIGEKLSVSSEFSVGVPLVGEGKIKVMAQVSASQGGSRTWRTATGESWEIPVKAPPRTRIVCTSTMKKHTVDVPFTYTIAWYSGSRHNVVKRETFAGVYHGVSYTDLVHEFTQQSLVKDEGKKPSDKSLQ